MFRISDKTLSCTNTKCDNISSKLEIVEKRVIESLKNWLSEYEEEINNIDISQTNNSNIIKIKKEQISDTENKINECNDKLEKIYDFLEKGIYTIDIFTERKNKILTEQKELTTKLQTLYSETENLVQIEKSKIDLIPRVKNVLESYSECSSAKEKNDLLKTVIEKVEYLKTQKCYSKNSNLENFELLIYPKF